MTSNSSLHVAKLNVVISTANGKIKKQKGNEKRMHINCELHKGNERYKQHTQERFQINSFEECKSRIREYENYITTLRHIKDMILSSHITTCPKCQQEIRHQVVWGDAICHKCGRISEKIVGY